MILLNMTFMMMLLRPFLIEQILTVTCVRPFPLLPVIHTSRSVQLKLPKKPKIIELAGMHPS